MITKMAMNRKKRNRAMSAAAPAMPVNPNSAAMIAITRNIAAHFNMFASVYPLVFFSLTSVTQQGRCALGVLYPTDELRHTIAKGRTGTARGPVAQDYINQFEY